MIKLEDYITYKNSNTYLEGFKLLSQKDYLLLLYKGLSSEDVDEFFSYNFSQSLSRHSGIHVPSVTYISTPVKKLYELIGGKGNMEDIYGISCYAFVKGLRYFSKPVLHTVLTRFRPLVEKGFDPQVVANIQYSLVRDTYRDELDYLDQERGSFGYTPNFIRFMDNYYKAFNASVNLPSTNVVSLFTNEYKDEAEANLEAYMLHLEDAIRETTQYTGEIDYIPNVRKFTKNKIRSVYGDLYNFVDTQDFCLHQVYAMYNRKTIIFDDMVYAFAKEAQVPAESFVYSMLLDNVFKTCYMENKTIKENPPLAEELKEDGPLSHELKEIDFEDL